MLSKRSKRGFRHPGVDGEKEIQGRANRKQNTKLGNLGSLGLPMANHQGQIQSHGRSLIPFGHQFHLDENCLKEVYLGPATEALGFDQGMSEHVYCFG